MPQIDIVENFADQNVLTQAQLHSAFLSIENFLNLTKLDAENIQSGAISTGLVAAEAITTEKYAPSSILLSKLATEIINRLNPAGAIQAYGGDTIPNGYLLCDGSAISRTTFAALFGAIGTKHGNGDGSTTFNLPDYRGRFLRGKDFATGRDPDAAGRTAMQTGGSTGDAVGSIQDDQLGTHGHGVSDPGHTHNYTTFQNVEATSTSGGGARFPVTATTTANVTGLTVNNYTASETRPKNANVNFIIKT